MVQIFMLFIFEGIGPRCFLYDETDYGYVVSKIKKLGN